MLKSKGFRFNSMPNFRLVDQDDDSKLEKGALPLLYRSSRPDFMTETDILKFKKLGIRSIIDFRSAKEYSKANGNKLLDAYYPVCKVHINMFGSLPEGQPSYRTISPPSPSTPPEGPYGKHFLIDFFKANYIWAVYSRAPWWFRLYSLLYLLYDLIMNTGYIYFVRAFAQKVLNKDGLLGQYIDMLTHSQAPILSALRLLSDPANLPAMINCAHGKDRTGIVSALTLGCIDKSKEYIAQNYAVSAEELGDMRERLDVEIVQKLGMCPTFTTANYNTMIKLLEHIDHKYGSISEYLASIGFTQEEQDQLKQSLLSTELTQYIVL